MEAFALAGMAGTALDKEVGKDSHKEVAGKHKGVDQHHKEVEQDIPHDVGEVRESSLHEVEGEHRDALAGGHCLLNVRIGQCVHTFRCHVFIVPTTPVVSVVIVS